MQVFTITMTESIIGRYFAQGGRWREKVVLATRGYGDEGLWRRGAMATRGYGDMGNGDPENWPNTSRLSAIHIR